MEYFFDFYLNTLPVILQGIMHLIFTGRLTGKKQKTWYFIVYLLLLSFIQQISSALPFPAGIPAVGMELSALYAVNRFIAGNNHSVSWTASALAVYIYQLSFGIIDSVEAILFPLFIGNAMLYPLLFSAVLAAYLLCICCYAFMLKGLSLKENTQSSYLGLLLFPVLFLFAAELYLLQTSYVYDVFSSGNFSLSESGKHLILLSLQVLGLSALLCIQYAYQHICRSFETQAALASLTQASRAQKTYIAEAQMRYEQTKSFRHDIKNHLSVLGGLLNSEKTEEAKTYLQKLETASAALSFPYQTGNPVVDILLSEKLGLAQAQGISTEVSLILPRVCILDNFDLCVIFSNALDNAIEACRKAEEKEKFIELSGKQQGNFYFLEIKNTCSNQPLPPTGTGLSNIRAAAEKYHGAVMIDREEGCFCLNILLNICSDKENRTTPDISIQPDNPSDQLSCIFKEER